jgi:choline kinase
MEKLILKVKNIIRTKIISSETDLEFIKNIERYEGFCIGIVVITDDEIDIQFRGTISEHSKTIGNYIVNRIRTFKHKLLGNIKFFLSLNDGIDFPSDIKDFIILRFYRFSLK